MASENDMIYLVHRYVITKKYRFGSIVNVFFNKEDVVKFLLEKAENQAVVNPYSFEHLVEEGLISDCDLLWILREKNRFECYNTYVKYREIPLIMQQTSDYKSMTKVNPYTFPSDYAYMKGEIENVTGVEY